MIEGTIEKQPSESFVVGLDFTNWLASGETINAGPTVTSKNLGTGADSTGSFLSGAPIVTGSVVKQRVIAGTDGDRHRVQCRIVTSSANTYEAEMDISVREF